MIDRLTAETVRLELQAAAAEVYKRNGLDAPKVSCRYTSSTIKVTIEGAELVEGKGGVNVASPKAQDFITYAWAYGHNPDALGREVTWAGRRVVVTGLNTRAPRYPYEGRDVTTGQIFRFPKQMSRVLA